MAVRRDGLLRQNPNDLLFREPARLHDPSPSEVTDSTHFGSVCGAQATSKRTLLSVVQAKRFARANLVRLKSQQQTSTKPQLRHEPIARPRTKKPPRRAATCVQE